MSPEYPVRSPTSISPMSVGSLMSPSNFWEIQSAAASVFPATRSKRMSSAFRCVSGHKIAMTGRGRGQGPLAREITRLATPSLFPISHSRDPFPRRGVPLALVTRPPRAQYKKKTETLSRVWLKKTQKTSLTRGGGVEESNLGPGSHPDGSGSPARGLNREAGSGEGGLGQHSGLHRSVCLTVGVALLELRFGHGQRLSCSR